MSSEAVSLTVTGGGALSVNLFCAFTLGRFHSHRGSLTKAAFLSALNDGLANVGIIAAVIATLFIPSIWPDLVVGLGIAAMNIDAARAVWTAAGGEHRTALIQPKAVGDAA